MGLCGNAVDGALFLQHHEKRAGHLICAGLLGNSLLVAQAKRMHTGKCRQSVHVSALEPSMKD